MYAKRLLTVLILGLAGVVYAAAQNMPGGKFPASPSPGKDKAADYRPGSAWTLSYPLGIRFDSTLDTLTLNYQRQAIPAMASDAYATTGNLGAEGQNQIYFDRDRRSDFFFADALKAWIPSFERQKLYNMYVPTTILSYNFGGGRNDGQDRLRATLAGNVNRRIGIGAFIDYLYSKGSYNYQATKDLAYGFSGYYNGDRYEAQAFMYQYNFLNKENGGITDDLYITDPAELQGGVSKIEAKSIPTRLSDAHTRLRGTEFYMSHAYNVGFWREEQVNDTLTRDVYVPVTKFIYSFDYRKGVHKFKNTNTTEAEKFWDSRCYLDRSGTYDNTSYYSIINSLGISMIEGFQKWAKFGMSAYATLENRHYDQANKDWTPPAPDTEGEGEPTAGLTPLPGGAVIDPTHNQTLLWVGGQIAKQQGATIRYDADAKFGLVGDVAGDIDINGRLQTNIRMFGDTVKVTAKGYFRNLAQPYLLQKFISNHYAWSNDFGKTRSFRASGEIVFPWTGTTVSAGWESMDNYVYFNTAGTPVQHSGGIHIFNARLFQHLKFGIWNWDNSLTYQTSSNQEVIPLPQLTIYSNMYLNFKAFRVLNLYIGVDCDYYTRYRGVNYEPATMTFRTGDDWKTGNFAICNAYVTAKLHKVRFYVLYSHFNQGWFSPGYFSMPHYPVNPRRLLFGLSIDFAN